jgi:3-phenylpropionate/trans-cinnamate dioxygenase ferredoxin reductase subunit
MRSRELLSVVIVGAGLGGLRTAEELRRRGHRGPITLLGAETRPPYDRPPLSKDVLTGRRSVDDTTLVDHAWFEAADVDLRLGDRAVALDVGTRTVVTAAGTKLPYECAVIAVGLVPRWPPGAQELSRVHVLRSADDLLSLRADVATSRNALVVGGGFVGCEVATSLITLGLEVTLVEPRAAPLAAALGECAGALVARLHVAAGVELRCEMEVESLESTDAGINATFSDGSRRHFDLVVCGIGSDPAVSWLEGSGVHVGNGILCDQNGRTSAPEVWALGDAAAWLRPAGAHHRAEHWTRTRDQASVVAAGILEQSLAVEGMPAYVWSDQAGLKIQVIGETEGAEEVVVLEDDGRKFLCAYGLAGRLIGAAGAGMPGKMARMGRLVSEGAGLVDVVAHFEAR